MTASTGDVPGRIFMSYRREDTAYPAGWLYDRLASHFGRDQVFKDIDSIELGDDFIEVINTAVGSCDVLLALIGGRWLTFTGQDGRRRLDSPDDFVRLEIEAALARNVRVIPILVDAARMPHVDELPPSLAKLARRQALELSPSRFDTDTQRLLRVLDRTVTEAQAQTRREAEEAEEAAARQRQVEQLQGRLRERAAKQDWDAVVAVSGELAALDPAAADPDGLASTAREQITRRRQAEEQARREAEEQARREAEDQGEATTSSQVGEDATSVPATMLASVAEAPEHAPETEATQHEIAAGTGAESAAPGRPDAAEPPKKPAEPAKRRRRLSNRARIITGIASAITITVITLAIVDANSSPPPPSPSSLLLTPTATIFQDSFSNQAYGWVATSLRNGSAGGQYGNGTYEAHVNGSGQDGGEVFISPKKASSVYPSAPSDIQVGVHTHLVRDSTGGSYLFYLECRADQYGIDAYQFYVFGASGGSGASFVQINKASPDGRNLTRLSD